MGSSFPWGAVILLVGTASAAATLPQDKRTILTSGDKVYVIHYQLGQSTVLSFGLKPETVICGNKNYFNIEKIKDGITIQPLSTLSTNLTVLSQGRRYLFYLAPTGNGQRPDSFVDVKWVPRHAALPVSRLAAHAKVSIQEINQKARLSDFEFTVVRKSHSTSANRTILDLELRNLSERTLSTTDFKVIGIKGIHALKHQIAVWEKDGLEKKKSIRGRLIVTGPDSVPSAVVISSQDKTVKIVLSGRSR